MTPEEWILMPGGSYVGTSSATIWAALTGKKMPFGWHADVPVDADDFFRCHQLLELIPEWRSRLAEVAARFPKWEPLVAAWDELEYLYLEARKSTGSYDAFHDRLCDVRGVRRYGESPIEFHRRSVT